MVGALIRYFVAFAAGAILTSCIVVRKVPVPVVPDFIEYVCYEDTADQPDSDVGPMPGMMHCIGRNGVEFDIFHPGGKA